jgi:predicted nucleic acid-binding protein
MARYYIDTCLWIDFIEGRTDDDVFTNIIEDEDIIVYSYPLEKELLKYLNLSQLRMLYTLLSSKGLLYSVNVTDIEKFEAHELSNSRNLPFADTLHAVLARDNDAVLLTRDKHFLILKDICDVKLF